MTTPAHGAATARPASALPTRQPGTHRTATNGVAKAGAILHCNVTRCPCAPAPQCPALDEIKLLETIEHAVS